MKNEMELTMDALLGALEARDAEIARLKKEIGHLQSKLNQDRPLQSWCAAEDADIFREAAARSGLDVLVEYSSPTGEKYPGRVHLFSREHDLSVFWREVETLRESA